MRRLVTPIILIIATTLLTGWLPAEAAQTFFGKAATIADHTGTITGTEGKDVIIGDDGDNEIDAQGGVDYVCGGGGNDEIVTVDETGIGPLCQGR